MSTSRISQDEFVNQLAVITASMKDNEQILSSLAPKLISANAEDMSYVCSFTTEKWMSNHAKQVHGGIIATIADNIMGCLALLHNELCFTPTVSMNIDYLSPIPACSEVFVEAKITKLGRNIIFETATFWLENRKDKPCVTVTGIFAATDKKII